MRPEEVTVAGSVMVQEYEEVEVAENRGPQYVSGLNLEAADLVCKDVSARGGGAETITQQRRLSEVLASRVTGRGTSECASTVSELHDVVRWRRKCHRWQRKVPRARVKRRAGTKLCAARSCVTGRREDSLLGLRSKTRRKVRGWQKGRVLRVAVERKERKVRRTAQQSLVARNGTCQATYHSTEWRAF